MEGAAFAQVATQEEIPWIVMRVISDIADKEAPDAFNEFIKKYKSNSFDLIRCILEAL